MSHIIIEPLLCCMHRHVANSFVFRCCSESFFGDIWVAWI